MIAPTRPLTVAVMQPYFLPYAGYWRLLVAADLFLVFDCVQFPRRGRVHRCELPGGRDWLTLPLAPAARETRIADMRLAADARSRLDARLRGLAWIGAARGPAAATVRGWLAAPLDGRPLVDVLEETLRGAAALLGLPARIARSSALQLPAELRGARRVIAAVQAVGGTRYVNAPGGRTMYDAAGFAGAGIELSFLTPYAGAYRYLLSALLQDDPRAIAEDIRRTTLLEPP